MNFRHPYRLAALLVTVYSIPGVALFFLNQNIHLSVLANVVMYFLGVVFVFSAFLIIGMKYQGAYDSYYYKNS